MAVNIVINTLPSNDESRTYLMLRGCLKNSARSEDRRKLRIKIWFYEVNSGSICRIKADF